MREVLAFFGAFNPPTSAHIGLAEFAMEQCGSSGVVFVPSKTAYIKDEQGKDYAYGEEQRLSMLAAAAESRSWMQVEDWEIRCSEQPRTYETLCHLRERGFLPKLLMGSDKLGELEHGWLYVDRICSEFGIVCMQRRGDNCSDLIAGSSFLQKLSPMIRIVNTPQSFHQISSTEVRRLVTQLRQYVPPEILPQIIAGAMK